MRDDVPLEASWTVRASFKPLMGWVWIGCFLMALGGGLAIFDKRYLKQKKLYVKSKNTTGSGVLNTEKLVHKLSQTKL